MRSVENILVPIDFSEESKVGLRAAKTLAERFHCRIHLSHFLLPNANIQPRHPKEVILEKEETVHQQQKQQERIKAYDKLKALLVSEVDQEHQGHACIVGDSLDNLFEKFSKESGMNIDLIVSGTSATRNWTEIFTGNRTENMIRSSNIPILAVAEGERLSFNNIVVSTDLSKKLPENIQRFCKTLYDTGSSIHFVHVMTTAFITEEQVEKGIKRVAHSYQIEKYQSHIVRNHSEIDGLNEILKAVHADMVFMKTYPKKGLMTYFIQSLAEQTIRETDIPVLVEPMPELE